MADLKDITKKNFENDVVKSKLPVIIDFWATWCGPCRQFSPIIEEVSKEFDGKINFYKLNVDEDSEIAAKYDIMSIPTVMLFVNGKPKSQSVGAMPKESLRKWINSNL